MEQMPVLYANIILPLALPGTFSYLIPNHLISEAAVGKRVVIEFGSRKLYTGLIDSIQEDDPGIPNIKEILEILDAKPIVTAKQFQFWQWMQDYYICNPGDVMRAALPSGLKPGSDTYFKVNTKRAEDLPLDADQKILLQFLIDHKKNKLQDAKKQLGTFFKTKIFDQLRDLQVINIEEKLGQGFKPKSTQIIQLADKYLKNPDEIQVELDKLQGAPRQLEFMELLLAEIFPENGTEKDYITRKDFLGKNKLPTSLIPKLVEKGLIVQSEIEVSRLIHKAKNFKKLFELSPHQQKCLEEIRNQFQTRQTVLLHGVTSSGKTEIYSHLIEEVLQQGKTVLYLLPEIALSVQMIERLSEKFGRYLGVYHSKYSDNQRIEIWKDQLKKDQKEIRLILGTRSSIFLPFHNLGLIIVDEEHEPAYKQMAPQPRYNARDMAVVLAGIYQAKCLLGSATPSTESYHNALTGKYGYTQLQKRHLNLMAPEIVLSNIRKDRLKKQNIGSFSSLLHHEIQENLRNKRQIILFQNRRGFAPYLFCQKCGFIPGCKRCNVSLTYHQKMNKLLCHYCGYQQNVPQQCPDCHSHKFVQRGIGTEKIESEIRVLFPDSKIARLDLDSAGTRSSYERIIADFDSGKTNILIGTQMISKGLDFQNVGLVGILDADSMINFPDFRAHERSFQLMVQVAGRAGRKNEKSKVVIQTNDPEQEILLQVKKNDYPNWVKQQLIERKLFFYPPYSRLLKIIVKHRDYKLVNDASMRLAYRLRQSFGKNVLGPEYPLVNRIKNQFLKQILIKIQKNMPFGQQNNIIRNHTDEILNQPQFRYVQIHFDIDPL